MHVQALVRLRAARRQYFGTLFFRNRPELDLLGSLLDQQRLASSVAISVLACSKGAEVYSIAWAIRSRHPDLKFSLHAVDISEVILAFAERGVYSLTNREGVTEGEELARTTWQDQHASIFERMTDAEMEAMFDREGDHVRVKEGLKEAVTWHLADAEDPELLSLLGPQDVVVANRFLCHMAPAAAEKCLRSIARLVKPGGYLFVSGADVDVRTKVARQMGWRPVTHLIREVHEGDASLRRAWPLEYWGLEPLQDDRPGWPTRYASVFQLGEPCERGVVVHES